MEKTTTDIVFYDNDKMIEQAKGVLISTTITSKEKLKKALEQFKGLAVNGINDVPTHQAVKDGIKTLKKMSTAISTQRKKLTEPATTYQKSLIQEEKELIELIEPILTYLVKEDQRIEDAKTIADQELFSDRSKKLTEIGYQLASGFFIFGAFQFHSDQLVKFTEDEFMFYVNEGVKAKELKEKEDLEAKGLQDELMQMKQQIAQLQKEKEDLLKERSKSANKGNEVVEPETAKEPLEPGTQSTEPNPYKSEPFVSRGKLLLSVGYTGHPNDSKFIRGKEVIPYDTLLNMEQDQFDTYIQSQKPKEPAAEQSEFDRGWNAFRDKFIELMKDETIKHARPALIDWANNMKP